MPVPPNPILDNPAIGQFAMSVRVDVLDRSLNWLDSIKPLRAGNLTATTTGAVNRSWTGLVLTETEFRSFDAGSARLRPVIVLEDGSGPPGTTIGGWPLGVFVVVDAPRRDFGEQPTRALSLLDLSFALDQATDQTFSIEPGGAVYDGFVRLLDDARMYVRQIDTGIGARVWEAAAWQAGTSRYDIASHLANLSGVLPPYVNNLGTTIVRAAPEMKSMAPDYVYDTTSGRILADPPPEWNENLLDAPNLHVVKSTGPTGGPIVARAEVDPRSWWSPAQRGIAITEVHTLQALDGTDAAQRAADNFAAADPRAHQTIEFWTLPDPRHDLYGIAEIDEVKFREVEWSLGLDPGSRTQRHVCVRDEWEYVDQ